MKRFFHIFIQTLAGIFTGTAFWGLLAGLFFLALGPAQGDLAEVMKTFLSIFVLVFGAVHGFSIGLVTGLLDTRKILKGALGAIIATLLMLTVYNLWQLANGSGSFLDSLLNILKGTLVLAVPAVIIGIVTVLISRLFFRDETVRAS